MDSEKRTWIASRLLQWYGENKRMLPWRQEPTPYHVWVSEIMLQQTRVEAVKPYYTRFLEAFPTIRDLAMAEEEKLMKLWEGLGYYSRARNLQRAAKVVVEEYGGELPPDYQKLLKLPGIGPYTAGAIASIAFALPQAAVDGNVLRVFSRILEYDEDISLNASKKEITKEVEETLPVDFPGDFNQAVMELGATVCLPNAKPKCQQCPLIEACLAHQNGRELSYPVKSPKKDRITVDLDVFFICCGDGVLLSKRPSTGLLAGLWQLPNRERQEESIFSLLVDLSIPKGNVVFLGKAKHIFTHREWQMDGYYVEAQPPLTLPKGYCILSPEKIQAEFALPSAFREIYHKGLCHMRQETDGRRSNDN